jgi:hypothetical protein
MCGCNQCDPGFSSPMAVQRYCRKCHQWFNEACLATLGRRMHNNVIARIPSKYRDIKFDPEFVSLLACPIRRGEFCGVVGNGVSIIEGKALMEEARILGRLPDGWKDTMQQSMLQIGDGNVPRYCCLTCTTALI